MIYDPLRTCYLDLSADVLVRVSLETGSQCSYIFQDHIKKNAKAYGFDNVFGVPAYEIVLEKATVRNSSSVRNGLRQRVSTEKLDLLIEKDSYFSVFSYAMEWGKVSVSWNSLAA